MQTLMIADSSRAFADTLEAAFQDRFRIIKAFDGNNAQVMLRDQRPDVAVINLMLPYKDGLAAFAAILAVMLAWVWTISGFSS